MKYKYKAFISYRHSHKKIADKLQKLIETYKPPREYKTNEKIIVFRDETELPTSNNLDESIRENLRRSEYLIVLCSTDFQDSKWCMEELRYFQELHDGTNDNILVVIVDGDVEASIPKSLRTKKFQSIDKYGNKKVENKSIEPLAANIVRGSTRRSLKALKTEFLRLEAVILNCGYDDLYRREHRRKVRKIISFFSVASIVLLSLTMYSLFMFVQINEKNMQISEKNINLQIENSKNLSMMAENEMELKNPFSAIKYAVKALPDETETKPILPSSELTLSNILSVFSYQSDLPYSFMELPGSIKDLEYANDGKTIVVKTTITD